jgi:hypothetical protein
MLASSRSLSKSMGFASPSADSDTNVERRTAWSKSDLAALFLCGPGKPELSAVASPVWKPTIGANFGFNLRLP